MHELKVPTLTADRFPIVGIHHLELEQRIVVPRHVITLGPSREFLVGRHQRGSDVVCEEVRVGVLVQELNDILVSDDTAAAFIRDFMGRDDFPFIVGVRVGVPGDLLTCSQSSDTIHQAGDRDAP